MFGQRINYSAIGTLIVAVLAVAVIPVLFFSPSVIHVKTARDRGQLVLRVLMLAGLLVVSVGAYFTVASRIANGTMGRELAETAPYAIALIAFVLAGQAIVYAITGGTWAEAKPFFDRALAKIGLGPREAGLRKDHLRGMHLADLTGQRPPAWLTDSSLQKPVALGWMPYPSLDAESQHTVIEGATGTGKSQAIKALIAEILERGDHLIAVDGGGDLLKTFGTVSGAITRIDIMEAKEDRLLSAWSPSHEIERMADWDQIAQGLIGDGSGDSAEWRSMAKALFAAVGLGYASACADEVRPFNNREFFDLLMSAPDDVIAPFVSGTPAAALIGNGKGLSSVRMSLLSPLGFFKFLPDAPAPVNGLSVRKWMRNTMKGSGGQKSLFLTFRKRDLATVRSPIAAMIDLMIATAIDEGKSPKPIWLVIDELAGLGEIPSLLMGAAELRKTGVRLVVGMQDYDQIEDIYGRARAASITNNLSNKLILRTTSGNSAERLSRTLGEQRVMVYGESTSSAASMFGDPARDTYSMTLSEKDERAVMPAELLGLPDLTGYVRMAGQALIVKTPIPVFGGFHPQPKPDNKGLPGGTLIGYPR